MGGVEKGKAQLSQLPPPPPKMLPMPRRGMGSRGKKVQLLTNHFHVEMTNSDRFFYHYSVKMSYEDGHEVDAKGIGRKVIDKVRETYEGELRGKHLAYDGEKSLFTLGALPCTEFEFTVVLEEQRSGRAGHHGNPSGNGSPNDGDKKRLKRPQRTNSYKVSIRYATRIPMHAIASALRGQDSEHFQEAVRVLDVILRQNAARQGCLLVRQSFFQNNPRGFVVIGGGVDACRGFHASFRATQAGLSLNMDVSTTMTVHPGPVLDFLIANQNVRDPYQIDWAKAKRSLKNLRIIARPANTEHKIFGLSEKPCGEQLFELKQRKNGGGEIESTEITVYDYFVSHRKINLKSSGDFPCINVGKPKHPTYFPLELCELVSLQRYTKALSGTQRASLVEKSCQKPHERMKALTDALMTSNYGSDPLLKESGIAIRTQFTQVNARVLSAPKLRVGNGEDFFPSNGRWNFSNKTLFQPTKPLEEWVIVNFSARCDINILKRDLVKCGERKGMRISEAYKVFEEPNENRRFPPSVRVDKMISTVKAGLPGSPQMILCILPEKKKCDLYGPWKKRILSDIGVVTQCIAPTRLNDQYLISVLLKINCKLGGLNSILTIENDRSIPLVSSIPTLIIGMSVSHGGPGQADVPSIAAVVSSRKWPSISHYRASVRTQTPKVEIIDGLFKPVGNEDNGMIKELLKDFYVSSGKVKPEHIIIFRDGVSESQFNKVLNNELVQIKQAWKHVEERLVPKFTVIVAQKNHHTKFFQEKSPENVPPGTVIDNTICHPKNYDFYMCAQAGMIGTSRPTHYHVLHDEIGFSANDLQELVHSLSYVYQRSTTAISVVAPICYAHLAAAQVGQFIKFDDYNSSGHGSVTSSGTTRVTQLPTLHKNVRNSMFFC